MFKTQIPWIAWRNCKGQSFFVKSLGSLQDSPRIQEWYFVSKIVLSSDLFWPSVRKKNVLVIKKIFCKFEAEGSEFVSFLRSIQQFIQTVKDQNNFWKKNTFHSFTGGFYRSNILEQLIYQLEQKMGCRNLQEPDLFFLN